MRVYPSIFNDVIGPVMRGPSSSHCAASLRIGRLCRDLMEGQIKQVLIEFDPNGSLATTHESQGSDMGLFGGFMGWEADDERLADSTRHLETRGIKAHIHICNIGADHPNTYQITLKNDREEKQLVAISTGGGMIEVISIDGASVSLFGDKNIILVYTQNPASAMKGITQVIPDAKINIRNGKKSFIEISSRNSLSESICQEIKNVSGVIDVRKLNPILPVLSMNDIALPFLTCNEMLDNIDDRQLWELAVHYESVRGSLSKEEVMAKMDSIVDVIRNAVRSGLQGTEYEDRILGPQSVGFREQMKGNRLLGGDLTNRMIMYVSAIMEVKSSMGVIVAAPTAGSCGALPGAVLAVADSKGLKKEEIVKAMLSAGLIGLFIAEKATFAAEVAGCQAECGAGSSMAAAALVQLAGGTLDQSISAASLALQNSLGMICDPIANRVEAPCLGKNVMAASNALSCANMALANYNALIPLDEVIESMNEVANKMHSSLRCTGLGGLAATPSARNIEKGLKTKQFYKSC